LKKKTLKKGFLLFAMFFNLRVILLQMGKKKNREKAETPKEVKIDGQGFRLSNGERIQFWGRHAVQKSSSD
jgi:hypothetical protein